MLSEMVLGVDFETLETGGRDEFIYNLLSDDAVISEMQHYSEYDDFVFSNRGLKLRGLIKSNLETLMYQKQREDIQDFLIEIVRKMAHCDSDEISDVKLSLMLKDNNILEAIKAWKVAVKNADRGAHLAAEHTLWMLMGQAR